MRNYHVVVIGAGPYGLSTAAHLQSAGIEPYVIGQPLSFWKSHMPKKMLLRSRNEACNIAAPQRHLSLESYQKVIGRKLAEPLPIEDFTAYGDWFQKQIVPKLDTRQVQRVSRNGSGFVITVDDGEQIHATSVILALGIGPFNHRPEAFSQTARELAPHSSDLNDLSQFAGRRVAVIGKGQSALEYAAILHEHNADVEILTRSATVDIRKVAWRKHLFRRLTPGLLRPFSYKVFPPTDLGNIKTARVMADPKKFRRQSPEIQAGLIRDCTTPIGADWLRCRLEGVRSRTGISVVGAELAGDGLKLTMSDGTTDRVDRVVLATGYKIDISKYSVLDSSLKQEIQKTPDGYPLLTTGLQTSVKGLYMAGAVAERTLGPTLRFVTGTSNAGPALTAAIKNTPIHKS